MPDLETTASAPAPKPTKPALKVLSGTYPQGLDQRARLTIPADWRDQMGNPAQVMVMKDWTEKALILLTPEEEEQYHKKISGKMFNTKIKKLSTIIGKNSETIPFDSQGRLSISSNLLAHACITKSATLVGCGNRIQIYSPDTPDPDAPFNMEELAAAVEELEAYFQ
jgi:division/cell wall cluster transcriptional repressor MraZ